MLSVSRVSQANAGDSILGNAENGVTGVRLRNSTDGEHFSLDCEGDNRVFVYFGPRMDAPPADPYEGTLLYDEPGVRSYIFAQRGHAMAHFLRATQGLGAALSLLSRRAPELRHIRRWTQALFAEPAVGRSTQLLAGWFATSGAGFLFVPAELDQPFAYCEVAIEG